MHRIRSLLEEIGLPEHRDGVYESPYGPIPLDRDSLVDLCMAAIAAQGRDASWTHTLTLVGGDSVRVPHLIVDLLFELVYTHIQSLKPKGEAQLELPLEK